MLSWTNQGGNDSNGGVITFGRILLMGLLASPDAMLAADVDVTLFESKIRPTLAAHCYECHSGDKPKGGLRLDYRGGWEKGGKSGPVVEQGRADASLLIRAIRHEDANLRMPKGGEKLPEDMISAFETWIVQGAPDPRDQPPSKDGAEAEAWKAQLAERSRWWSLQPPKAASPPDVFNSAWAQDPVDRFVLAKLEAAGLRPAKPAAAETLLRRLSFVLTGLPPKAERVAQFRIAFARDADVAMAGLVDELLASPHFGERFARHWMDVVRYTDTYGYEWDIQAKGSFEYRDYLTRAFNDDIGFDQLIREQIAGDLLPEPRVNEAAGVNESLIGPMFYHLGEHRHGSSLAFNGIHQEMIDNKVDAFSKAFLAMTVACARCHDHKLDAISQADYYALAGVFMTPRWTTRSIDSPGKNAAAIAELKSLRDDIRSELAKAWSGGGGGGLNPDEMRTWAFENRASLSGATIEDVAYPIHRLANDTGWTQLLAEWRATRDARRKSNESFTALTDFSTPGFPAGWAVEGEGLRHGHVRDGAPRVSLDGNTLISEILPRGYHTHALSSKLPGAVRIPAPERFPRARVSLRLKGGEWAGRLVVPQNAFLNEGPIFFDPAAPLAWTSLTKIGLTNGVSRAPTEISTASLNPNFPPRTGVARSGKVVLPNTDEGFDKRSWFSVTGIVAHDGGGLPGDESDVFVPLYEGKPPASTQDAWRRVSDWLKGAVDRWAAGGAAEGDVRALNWMLAKGLLPNDGSRLPRVAALVGRYRDVEARIDFPRSANGMDERGMEPVNYRLNVRGDVNDEGPAIRRNFLEVFSGRHGVGDTPGSGRLELARYLGSRENPQTARVYVNRVWQWLYGEGIVSTPSDFGKLGGRPSHPELLDWLALEFMEEGWSTKKLVRRLALSRTFRQAGEVGPAGAERDASNRLLHHYPTRRLEAEEIRDSLLAVSGRLDSRLYGRPINPPRIAEDSKKRLFSGPLDGDGRRSLYLEMSIMQPPEFLVGFNLPDLKLPAGKRDVTNVPAQALAMLNDPFVNAMAGHWADRLIAEAHSIPADRLRAMFAAALGREPSAAELARWQAAVRAFAGKGGNLVTDREAWTAVAHALFNTKEFLYYR